MAANACGFIGACSTLLSSLYGVADIKYDMQGLRNGTVLMAKTEHP